MFNRPIKCYIQPAAHGREKARESSASRVIRRIFDGSSVLKKFCHEIHESRGIDSLCVIIERTNGASAHLFEKLDAKYEGMKVILSLDEVFRKSGITVDPSIPFFRL